jgi:hypothetical protein
MALSNDEKALVEEAISVYLQVVARQMGPGQAQQLAKVAQGVIAKLDSVGQAGDGTSGSKPNGISDEWYENVCTSCNKLTATGCSDKVTERFPGKCDPILHYERNKTQGGS